MAETLLNRARVYNAPEGQAFSASNSQSQILASNVVADAPLVALAYSYAVLEFEGNSTHAGQKIAVACNGHTITVTLNNDGEAQLSLQPFIREAVLLNGTLDNPLYCDDTATTQDNGYRGYIDVTITETNQTPTTMRIYYIFGNYAPKGELVTDLYFDYDANGETWVNVDDATNYTASGVPNGFEGNWCDINKIVESEPSGDFVMPLLVAWYYGKDNIQFNTINYHFRYDCRVDNMLKVRWLDQNGNINVRKFVKAGRANGVASSGSWTRPHNYKEIVDGYDFGKDEWRNLTASESLTIGDDNIPMTHYDWLKTLGASACVEAFIGGAWTRVNLGDAKLEADPRKATFTATFTLALPTDDVQKF